MLRVIREVLAHGSDAPERPKRRRGLWPWASAGPPARPRGHRATNIGGALEFLLRVAKRKTVCFVVSDFFDDGYERVMRMANRKHDVIAVCVTDPRELNMPEVGLIALTDPETGQRGLYDTSSPRFRHHFEALARRRGEQLEQRFRKSGIDFIRIDADGSVVDPLVRFFRLRERRMRR